MLDRPLTQLEQEILDYIRNRPGLTAYDLAEVFGQTEEEVYEEVYYAVAYLVWNVYATCDPRNSGITAKD